MGSLPKELWSRDRAYLGSSWRAQVVGQEKEQGEVVEKTGPVLCLLRLAVGCGRGPFPNPCPFPKHWSHLPPQHSKQAWFHGWESVVAYKGSHAWHKALLSLCWNSQ